MGNVGVLCLDFTGREVWFTPLEPHKMGHGWGTAASPVLHRDRLYLLSDNDEKSYLLALDKSTEELAFQTALGPMAVKTKFNLKDMSQSSEPGL